MQYVPEEGLYVYFRYDNKQTVMVIINTSKQEKKLNWIGLKQIYWRHGFSKMKNIFTGKITALKDFSMDAKESGVYELIK